MAQSHHSARLRDTQLRVDGVSISFAERRVLTDVSLTVAAGERVGLIGENGTGKTTLLRIIAGLTSPTAGTVAMSAPGGGVVTVGLLRQEPPFAVNASINEALESAVAPAREAVVEIDQTAVALAQQPEDAAAGRAYSAALETAERLDAWNLDARIAAMLAGLGLAGLPGDRLTGQLSGGQRSRLSLAWILLSAPDILLLDEPTNHLDDDAVAYLQQLLTSWPGPVLMASHDRAFLDGAVTALADLDPSPLPHAVTERLISDGNESGIGLTRFTGIYTDYVQAQRGARARWERRFGDEQNELKRLRSAVRDNQSVGHADFKPRSEVRGAAKFFADRNAKVVSRRVNDSRSRLDELEQQQIRKPPHELTFGGLTAANSATTRPLRTGPVLSASKLAVAGRLRALSLTFSGGEKWLITGPNGSGKSTLLLALAGRVSLTSGTVSLAQGVRVGLLTQEVVLPDPQDRGPERSARQAYADLVGTQRAVDVPLSAFGLLPGRDENRPVGVLSTGQLRRLELAVLLADPPAVLLLDEPTNHFALALVTHLEAAIPEYPGVVIVASHDRWLRRNWTGQKYDLTDH